MTIPLGSALEGKIGSGLDNPFYMQGLAQNLVSHRSLADIIILVNVSIWLLNEWNVYPHQISQVKTWKTLILYKNKYSKKSNIEYYYIIFNGQILYMTI